MIGMEEHMKSKKSTQGIEASHGNIPDFTLKLEDIPGSEYEKRALEVALAGGHSMAILYNSGSMAQEIVRVGVRLAQEIDVPFHAIAFPWCKCGHYGSPRGECLCSHKSIISHLEKLAKRVKDFDIWISASMPSVRSRLQKGELESVFMGRVKHMRAIRMGMSDKKVQEAYNPSGTIDATSQAMIDAYLKNVSPRLDIDKVKAIALTIAELDFCGPVGVCHFAEALQYQPQIKNRFNEVIPNCLAETVEVQAGDADRS